MSGFFAKIFCCGSGKAKNMAQRPNAVPPRNSTHPSDRRPNHESRHNHNHHNAEQSERRRQAPPPKPKKQLLKITSQYTAQTVKAVETRSEETKDCKYMCPICFRYFNRILTSTCCENYVCHHCANDINEKVLNDEKVHVARCPLCTTENFELVDVNITVKPKKYTDSFYSSFKSNTKGGGLGNTQFVNRLAGTINNREQLYASVMTPEENQYSMNVRDDFRSASDGLQYFKRDTVEPIEEPRFNKTADFRYGMSEDGGILQRDFTDILSRKDNRSERPKSRHTESEIEERKSNALDDSLNDRDPIDVIKEDEFENSTVTNLDRGRGMGAFGSPY